MPHIPLVIAHRGASREAPENTLPAFEKALQAGADGVELDILPTKDGKLVVTHNETLMELAGVKGKVKQFTLQELKKLDFGSHFSPQFKGEKIPTLEEVFELVQGKKMINVEIKGINIRSDGREEALVKLIRRWDCAEQIVVSSFNIFALIRMAQQAPEIRRGYLFYEKQMGPSRRAGWAPLFKPYSLHVSKALVKKGTIEKYHQKGYKVWTWTVNEEKEMKSLMEQGADAIITDEPKKLISLLKKAP
ncbi:MAG: glycerophosphodiester phosphodiesterase family protein [bacterium]